MTPLSAGLLTGTLAICAFASVLALARMRRGAAAAVALAASGALLAPLALAFGAPSLAILLGLGFGGGGVLAVAAALLAEPRAARGRTAGAQQRATLVALAIGSTLAAVMIATPPAPVIAPVSFPMRPIDAALAGLALAAAGVGVVALLGFGERAPVRQRASNATRPRGGAA